VVAGEHADKFEALIAVERLQPEPVYLLELRSGEGDAVLADSQLAPAE